MRILLLGENGQVGWELNRSLQPLGEVTSFSRKQADFTDAENLRQIIRGVHPDIIVNAVAYTAVDQAEEEEALATEVNVTAPAVLAEEALKASALLIHYSTDYVFNGEKNAPYLETDKPAPINAYGRTKLAGEQAIQSSGCDYLIFRTSWVYAARASNFLSTIIRLAKEREDLSIVSDQIGAPTSARLIADTTILCIQQAVKERLAGVFSSDLYHLTASGHTSWHGFAEEIVKIMNETKDPKFKIKQIKAIPSSEYPTPAMRPKNSRLALIKLESCFSLKVPDWRKGLELCIEELD